MSRAPDDALAAVAARALGREPLPYQRDLWQRLSVPTLDGTGYAAPLAVVLWPRQCGKTTALFDLVVGRMAGHDDYRAAYTAQTGHAVSKRFTDPGQWLDQVEGSSLAAAHLTRRSAGTERITRPRVPGHRWGYGYLSAFAPKTGTLRGESLDLVIVDEAQEHDLTGPVLDAAAVPTFTTRPRAQYIVTGTAGGIAWFRDYVERGRRGEVLLDERGTWPADADPTDPAVWWEHHPGLRAGLTTEAALGQALDALGPDRFAQEYGNRFPADSPASTAVPITAWDAAAGPRDPADPLACLGFDVTPARDAWTLTSTTRGGHVRVVATGRNPTDLPGVIGRTGARVPIYAPPGQAGAVADLRARGHNAQTMTGGEYREACQRTHDRVVAGDLSHDGQAELRAAWLGAARSWHGDAWVISGRKSQTDVTPAVAVVACVHGLTRARVPRAVGTPA